MKQRKPLLDMKLFRERRERLAQLTNGSAVVAVANFEQVRNGTVYHSFRQNSNFYYLTGFEEPEAVFVFRPGMKPESVMFVRPRDPEKETWNGFRFGPEGVKQYFGMDEAYTLDEMPAKLVELLKPVDQVYYQMKVHPHFDAKFWDILEQVKLARGRSGIGLTTVQDLHSVVGEMRVIKSDYEIQTMRKAAQISANAHLEVMREIRAGQNELYLKGVFVGSVLKQGAQREGYGSILAGGANATCLHYVFNDEDLHDGDLFLIDAAGEYNYYTADITRTYPVNGRFSAAQKTFYQKVLDIQVSLVQMVRPGVTYQQIQDAAAEKLTAAMIDLNLLSGSVEQNIKSGAFRKYYPHSIGHFLGMDVHDSGLYMSQGQSRALQPGITLTIEPGLYVPQDDQAAPPELRGLGVRIEDDILVTTFGHENLTIAAPKEIADLEKVIGQAK